LFIEGLLLTDVSEEILKVLDALVEIFFNLVSSLVEGIDLLLLVLEAINHSLDLLGLEFVRVIEGSADKLGSFVTLLLDVLLLGFNFFELVANSVCLSIELLELAHQDWVLSAIFSTGILDQIFVFSQLLLSALLDWAKVIKVFVEVVEKSLCLFNEGILGIFEMLVYISLEIIVVLFHRTEIGSDVIQFFINFLKCIINFLNLRSLDLTLSHLAQRLNISFSLVFGCLESILQALKFITQVVSSIIEVREGVDERFLIRSIGWVLNRACSADLGTSVLDLCKFLLELFIKLSHLFIKLGIEVVTFLDESILLIILGLNLRNSWVKDFVESFINLGCEYLAVSYLLVNSSTISLNTLVLCNEIVKVLL